MDFSPCIEKIRDDRRILALYLLGSAQTGTMRPDSDVDLALLLEAGREMSPLERADLAAVVSSLLRRDVDLGELSSRNLVYAKEAILKGRRLFARDAARADLHETTLLSMYARFNEDRREVLDAYRA